MGAGKLYFNMSMKYLFPVLVFVFLISLTSVYGYLENNLYFTMAPNSSQCLSATLPTDMGFLDDDNYTVKIKSDFETNLNFIQTRAGMDNSVKIPICFSSEKRNEGDYSSYNISLSGTKFSTLEVNGGICVSSISGANKATSKQEQNPCEIINGLQDLFWLDLYPQQILSDPGQEETVYLEVWPSIDLDLDISIDTNAQINTNSSYLRLKQYERKQIELKVKVPTKGKYYLNVSAKVVLNRRYCDLPFCKKDLQTKISSGIGSKRDGWSFLVLPRFLSAYSTKPIEYVTIIENNLEDRNFSISLDLPPSLSADVKNITDFIRKGERKEFRFNVTILDDKPQKYTIDFAVKGDVERVLTAFLSLYESGDDLKRQWSAVRDGADDRSKAEVDNLVSRYLIDLKDNGFSLDEYNKIKEKIKNTEKGNKPLQTTQTTNQPTNPDSSQLIFFVLVPVIVIMVLLVFLFIKKRNV